MASNAPAQWPKLDLTGSTLYLSKLEEWKADSELEQPETEEKEA